MDPVLRCGLCNKPFEKQSTLKRHGYYCRTRKEGCPTRRRSCIACVKGKARCDNLRPGCSRCAAKGIECCYPAKSSLAVRSRTQDADGPRHEGQQTAEPTGPIQVPNFEGNIGTCHLDNSLFDGLDFADFLIPQSSDQSMPDLFGSATSVDVFPALSTPDAQRLPLCFTATHIPIPPVPTNKIRSLFHRPESKVETLGIGKLMFHTLKSYPLMMLRYNTLPPFIHSTTTDVHVEDIDIEPMTNCISLMQMISSGVRGNRKLFWRNVQQECERFRAEHMEMNDWQMLSAMQALAMYVLVRLEEGETPHNNHDTLVLTTIMMIAKQYGQIEQNRSSQPRRPKHDLQQAWRDWIWEESKRRVCVIYQVVDLLVFFDPAGMCEHPLDLLLAPLPANRQLWEAKDALVWKTEMDKVSEYQSCFGMAPNGELVKVSGVEMQQDKGKCRPMITGATSQTVTNWEEWCSSMDDFGSLVMLTASLVA